MCSIKYLIVVISLGTSRGVREGLGTMGTSFMTYVVFGGVSRIAVLDHCDGDPELQGVRIFDLMSNPNNKKSLERGLERCRDVSAEIAQSDRTAYRWYDRYIEDHPSHIFCGGEQLLL